MNVIKAWWRRNVPANVSLALSVVGTWIGWGLFLAFCLWQLFCCVIEPLR